APFQWAAIFHDSDSRFPNGAEGLALHSPSLRRPIHRLPCKIHCASCHTSISDGGRRMAMLFPELLGGIKSDEGKAILKFRDHICWGGRSTDAGIFEGVG
ncbi:hypothetical protein F5883DRAFT_418113, partial [Diaporthe sp. PMI_573]